MRVSSTFSTHRSLPIARISFCAASSRADFSPVWKSTSATGAPDNSSLSHFSAMTRPSWLRRAVRNRHRHAIERASRRWRGGRRGDSARTRRKLLISTQLLARADADVHELLAYRRPSSLADSDPVRRRRGEGGERPAPAGAADGPPRLREGVHGLHAAGPMLPGGSRGNGAAPPAPCWPPAPPL